MPTLDDALDAVHDAVLARLGRNDPMLAFAFEFGTPIPLSALAEPGGGGASRARATEFMSTLADTVPDLTSGFFRRSGRTVSGQYQLLAESAQPVPSSAADTFATIKAGALRRLDGMLGSVEGSGTFLPVNATPSNWYDPGVMEGWQHVHVQSEQQLDPNAATHFDAALQQWRSAPAAAPAGLPAPGIAFPSVPSLLPPPSYTPAQTTRATFDTDVLQRSHSVPVLLECFMTWVPRCALVRPLIAAGLKAANSPAAWVQINLDQDASLDGRLPAIPALLAFMNGQAVESFAPQPDKPDELTAFIKRLGPSFVPTGADRMVIDFDMNVVQLDRPWLAQDFLETPTWYVPGLKKGEFSAGQSVAGVGNLPVIPIGCVLARDLSIAAQWTTTDRSALDNSSDLGPFSLAGHQFDGNSGTITVKGLQAIGWLCSVVPLVPPNADPATS